LSERKDYQPALPRRRQDREADVRLIAALIYGGKVAFQKADTHRYSSQPAACVPESTFPRLPS
jgi:hypothetical protein